MQIGCQVPERTSADCEVPEVSGAASYGEFPEGYGADAWSRFYRCSGAGSGGFRGKYLMRFRRV